MRGLAVYEMGLEDPDLPLLADSRISRAALETADLVIQHVPSDQTVLEGFHAPFELIDPLQQRFIVDCHSKPSFCPSLERAIPE